MQICQAHWDALKKEISDLGLERFVSKTGAEAVQGLVDGSFDPLMGAHNAIVSNALDNFGLEALEDGCPICRFDVAGWLPLAAADQRDIAHTRGLLGDTTS